RVRAVADFGELHAGRTPSAARVDAGAPFSARRVGRLQQIPLLAEAQGGQRAIVAAHGDRDVGPHRIAEGISLEDTEDDRVALVDAGVIAVEQVNLADPGAGHALIESQASNAA